MRSSNPTIQFLAAAASLALIAHPAPAADAFHRLKDSQIRGKLASMEITDDTHWTYQYMREGTIKIFSMGEKATGKWLVQNNELCVEARPQDTDCFEVWLSGKKVQLRFSGDTGAIPIEGRLQKQTPRE